jgi:GH24 family phage-related lysozyme (muramidase)
MKNDYLNYDWSPVINFESGGEHYYNKFLKGVTWPGGASGLTIGIGADLGYMSQKEFDSYFSKYYTKDENLKLKSSIGIKGSSASKIKNKMKGINLSWEDAIEAFVNWTLPKFWKLGNSLWPKLDELEINAQIALISIVFNRGTSTKGDSRREMRNIKELVIQKDYEGIAQQIISMKRLWVGKNLDGLLKRRDIEAKMVESCI